MTLIFHLLIYRKIKYLLCHDFNVVKIGGKQSKKKTTNHIVNPLIFAMKEKQILFTYINKGF